MNNTNKKYKKIKGGKLVGQGAHGCVFDKELNCVTNNYSITKNRFKNNLVTKLSVDLYGDSTNYMKEWDVGTLIKSIPNYFKYFKIPIANCGSTINSKYFSLGEVNSELKKCKIYENVIKNKNLEYDKDENNIAIKKDNISYYPFRLHFIEKADIDLGDYIKEIKSNYINYLYLPFFLKNIILGIKKLQEVYVIHSDIKLQNILLNIKNNKNIQSYLQFYDSIPLCRITDFGICKDTFVFSKTKLSSNDKNKFILEFYDKYKFSYVILPPEFNIIAHLVKYHNSKSKSFLIKEITIYIKNNKLPFWDLDFVPKLINSLYTNNKLDFSKIYKYTKNNWKKYDLYSFGLMIYIIFINIYNNIIINTNFGIFNYDLFKSIFIELSVNLCNINPSKRYNTNKVENIINKIIDKYIYNYNTNSELISNITNSGIISSIIENNYYNTSNYTSSNNITKTYNSSSF